MFAAIRARRAARRAALSLLFRAFPGSTLLLAALALLAGIAPAAFAALVGRVVDQVPAALTGGLGSAPGRLLLGTLAAVAVVLVAQELVGAGAELVSTALYRRYDGYLLGRVLHSTTAGTGLELYEDPALSAQRDRAAQIARYGPGELVGGITAQWTARAQGLAATVLVATIEPYAAVLLAVVWIGVAVGLQTSYYRADPFWTDPMRRAAYLKDTGLRSEWAKELRIFGLGDWIVGRFTAEWTRVMRELWRARRTDYRALAVIAAVLVTAHALTLAWVAHAATAHTLTLGTAAVLVQGLLGMAAIASMEGDVWIENGAVPIPDVVRFESGVRELAKRHPAATANAPEVEQDIRFENIGFAYPGREPVFDGLDLTVPAGSSLAVVGLNGAGKTTLVKLLTGLSHPQRGRILIDGIDLAEIDPDRWRQRIAAIFADFVRYELPASDNIGLGAVEHLRAPDLDERVHRAATRVGVADLLTELPDGLGTTLSRRYEGGVDLSGGQWQRVALARAMLAVEAGARVLVLDEPTAHLDVRAEADIYDRFLDLTAGLTTLVISHRFSTVRRADRIVLLDGGRITEQGSHDELLAADGRYAHLFRLQAMRYHANGDSDDD
ncbi:ABC transporter ATP-binding protein [Flindersiella endophytica]